jgi:predicted nucleic acid-binding protein
MVDVELKHYAGDEAAMLEVEKRLARLRALPISSPASSAAVAAQRELFALSTPGFPAYHRVSHDDFFVAATAWHAGWGVLHYDEHFDRLEQALGVKSVWVLPRHTFAQIAVESSE